MKQVEEYLENTSPEKRKELQRIRSIVREMVPEAVESISYGMPAFKYKNRPLVYYGAFKTHMSIFPTAGPAAALKDELSSYRISKGTIQFTNENPLPEELIKKIIQIRLDDISKNN